MTAAKAKQRRKPRSSKPRKAAAPTKAAQSAPATPPAQVVPLGQWVRLVTDPGRPGFVRLEPEWEPDEEYDGGRRCEIVRAKSNLALERKRSPGVVNVTAGTPVELYHDRYGDEVPGLRAAGVIEPMVAPDADLVPVVALAERVGHQGAYPKPLRVLSVYDREERSDGDS